MDWDFCNLSFGEQSPVMRHEKQQQQQKMWEKKRLPDTTILWDQWNTTDEQMGWGEGGSADCADVNMGS